MVYRHHLGDYPRRCVMIGTTNDSRPLPNDPTGNSRFVVIECPEGCALEPLLDGLREQAWAETLHRWKYDGLTANLPRSLMTEQTTRNQEYRAADPILEDQVSAFLEGRTQPFMLPDVAEGLDASRTKAMAGELQAAGCERDHGKTTKSGRRGRYWWPPKAS